MVDLMEIAACSGAKWDSKNAHKFVLDSKTVAKEFGQTDLNITRVTQVDGISDWAVSVSKNLNYFYKSGSVIIETSDLGTIAVTVNPRYDSNIKNSHRPQGIHLNLNLPWFQNKPDETTGEGEIEEIKKYSIHGISSRRGMIKLKDLYNKDKEPFSEHTLTF